MLPSLGLNSQPRSDLVTVAQGGQELNLVTQLEPQEPWNVRA